MKYFLPVICASFLLSCSSPSSTASNASALTEDDESRIREIQMTLWQKAYDEQDTVLMDQLFHDDFQLVDDNGDTYSKEDEMTYVANYGPTYDEFAFDILSLNLVENGTAVIFGKGTMKGVDSGEAYITTYKVTNVLVKENGDWKAISSHVSGVKEERFPMAPTE